VNRNREDALAERVLPVSVASIIRWVPVE